MDIEEYRVSEKENSLIKNRGLLKEIFKEGIVENLLKLKKMLYRFKEFR